MERRDAAVVARSFTLDGGVVGDLRIDLATDQREQRRGAALIGDVHELHARQVAQVDDVQVLVATGTA